MPYENNARKHTEEDVQTIINSIQEFGFNDPVGVWGENNIIVEGHGRFLAAKKLGIKEIPCIRLDELSDEQRKAYTLAHNKTAEMSTWDFEKLEIELESISGIDMSEFGFDISVVEESETKEREDINYHESISVVIDCKNEEQAEMIFEKLQSEGYECHISTL